MTSVVVIFRVFAIVTTLLLVGSSVKTAMTYFVHRCCCSVMHNNSIKTYKYKEEVTAIQILSTLLIKKQSDVNGLCKIAKLTFDVKVFHDQDKTFRWS